MLWWKRLRSNRGVPAEYLSGCRGPEDDWGALRSVLEGEVLDEELDEELDG